MSSAVKSHPLSWKAIRGLGERNSGITVEVYAVPGGFIFTYAGCHDNHDCYGAAGGTKPFATIDDAVAAAEDVGDESNEPTGAGADVWEFVGDRGDPGGEAYAGVSSSTAADDPAYKDCIRAYVLKQHNKTLDGYRRLGEEQPDKIVLGGMTGRELVALCDAEAAARRAAGIL